MNRLETEALEIELLLEAISRGYGYDFRNYAQASLKRRIENYRVKAGLGHISELIPQLLYDKELFRALLFSLSVTVTEMFRDPLVYRVLREQLVPFLKTFPFAKVWCAGCATGEEVYSLAILLKEAGLAERTQIYATDINDESLQKAKEGIYHTEQIKDCTVNYQLAGGECSFSDYYSARYDAVIMDKELRENIVFANHNLVSDTVFGEMQLIVCRNTLIYFNKELQDRVLRLFRDSLCPRGFLCLGTKESLQFSTVSEDFRSCDAQAKLFQLR